ncbi:hypothetical protein L53_12535 [Hyphomonas sp. L-53-1-40]|uniref:DUF2274 domain-containing protein n=1 Tax=Hyphomonas sp. L-53-1-40 TaxID=1207058 RepID=UPI000458B1A6|nr:DUF2274 domain-containing protein [Hyphomonas sp. L-53-1-40]KCZ62481.1 hypothetical protein L53_12535 [Hyphomonas sp. L-53-1-40]
MSKVSLKIGPLPDRTPLAADLEAYSRIHAATYGAEASVAMLVPLMLEAFLSSDPGFRKAMKTQTYR